MNKRYLPVIAALMIAVTCSAYLPVFAQTLPTYIYAAPALTVVTIAQGDQERQTGVILLADTYADYVAGGPGVGANAVLLTQYKILVAYNGVPVVPSSWGCQVVEKDKYNPIKDRQFPSENLETVPVDMSGSFLCKFRWGFPGVGVLDLYYTGPGQPVAIADYVLMVFMNYAVGRNTVYGSDLQDVCVLGWPQGTTATGTQAPAWIITKPDGTQHYIYADPLGGWRSCEDLALEQKAVLGVPIPWN